MTTDNRFALDAAAVVQQLSREIAGMQARAVAQRALIEAAASQQRPDICERAATEVQIYEDAAARLLQVVQNIVTGRGVGGSSAAPPAAPASHDAAAGASKATSPQPPSSPLAPMQDVRYRVAMNAQNAPHKRHEAMVQLLVQLKTELPPDQLAQLRTAYTDIHSKWSGLSALAEELSALTLSPAADEASVRRSDQIRRVQMQLRRAAEIVGVAVLTTALCDEYRQQVDTAVAVLSGLTYRSDEGAKAEMVIAQLRRLRDDCDVAVRLRPVG
jgi:hypothetical protein